MARELTLKQRGFIKDYLISSNATLAVRKNYAPANNATARMIASENLTKPNIRAAIEIALQKQGLSLTKIATIHQRNIQQSKNISASNTALDMYYKLAGAYPVEKHLTVAVGGALTPEDLHKRLQEVKEELKRINNE